MYKILDDLKKIRTAQGITGYRLAKRLKTSQSFMSVLERKGNPRLSTLVKIFDSLGYEIRAVKK